jgi:SOS-response transcriptional repressor LexA
MTLLATPSTAFRMPSVDMKTLSELADALKRYIQRSGKTQRKISEEAGIPNPTYLSQMANGRVNWIESDYFRPLSDVLGLSIQEMKELNPSLIVTTSDNTSPYIPANVREIPDVILMPVYSLASAGMPMQDAEPLDYDPIAMPRDQWHPALVLFLAEGESMSDGQEDSIRSGDILHVDMRDTDPTEGRVMVVQIPGQGVTVKRVRMLGGAYWLFSDNPDQRRFPPFQADEAKILGGVRELTRKVKVRFS